jgi:uncharacterized membrane protein
MKWAAGIVSMLLGAATSELLLSDVPLGSMLAAAFAIGIALVIGLPIGLLIGHLMSRDSDVDTTAYRVVAWTNVVAWLIPAIGMVVSAMTSMFSRRSDTSRHLYGILSCVGGILALANAAIGAGLTYSARTSTTGEMASASSEQVFTSGDRSTERCPYAAREAWSDADVRTYCN